jgi:hypothetical protein
LFIPVFAHWLQDSKQPDEDFQGYAFQGSKSPLSWANDINLKPNHRVALLEILENLLLCLENT